MVFRLPVIRIVIALLLIPVSCSSVRGVKRISGEAMMYGMVYNEENMPVVGAEVFIDGKKTILTDTQGRFFLVSRQREEFTLMLVKAGYETIEGVFRFEPMDVIHLVMINAEQLMQRAEVAMEEGRYRDVINLCDRSLALNPGRIDAIYLKALSHVQLREYDRARYFLEDLQNRLGDRDYIRRVLEGLPQ